MKNSLYILLIIFFGQLAFGQKKIAKKSENDPQATKFLASLKAKYDGLTSYAMTFSVSILNPEGKEVESFKGSHTAAGSNYFIKMNHLDIVSNQKTSWNIDHNAKSIQINEISDNTKKSENPLDIIFNYKKLYKYRVKETLGANKIIIELIPLNKNNKIFKIDLCINTKTQQIINSKLYEKSGARAVYTISKTTFNPKLNATFFDINTDSYKKYEILDLR